MTHSAVEGVSEELHRVQFDDPPSPNAPDWQRWAEEQTIVALRAELRERRRPADPPEPPPTGLRLVRGSSNATIRIHQENVAALEA